MTLYDVPPFLFSLFFDICISVSHRARFSTTGELSTSFIEKVGKLLLYNLC